jgi:hypothetical protein
MELIGEASLRHGFKALGLEPARLGSSLTAV